MNDALKRKVASAAAKYAVNPFARLVAGDLPGWALIETIGRKTGKPRVTPVGDGLRGDTFWVIAEHGSKNHWVRNIRVNPAVRVKSRGRWRTGVATELPDADAVELQKTLRLNPIGAAMVRLVGTQLLVVRIDLKP